MTRPTPGRAGALATRPVQLHPRPVPQAPRYIFIFLQRVGPPGRGRLSCTRGQCRSALSRGRSARSGGRCRRACVGVGEGALRPLEPAGLGRARILRPPTPGL